MLQVVITNNGLDLGEGGKVPRDLGGSKRGASKKKDVFSRWWFPPKWMVYNGKPY